MVKIIVVGSGLTGCLTAAKIANKYKKFEITLIDSSSKVFQSMNAINIGGSKINNGYHALEINRAANLFSYLKKILKLKFKKKKSKRYLIINEYLIKEHETLKKYPENLVRSFKKRNLKSKNLVTFFNNLTGDLKKTIHKTSERYSNIYKDTLGFFIPWFLPREFSYISNDEGSSFREKTKKKNFKNFVSVPENGLFESLSKPFYQYLNKINNIQIKTNIRANYEGKKITFYEDNKKLDIDYDYMFFCSSPIFFLKRNQKLLSKLMQNRKLFVCCLLNLKKKIKKDFTEIICMIENFKELSRFSKINFKKNQKKCLVELIFTKKNKIKEKLNKTRIKKALEPILNDNKINSLNYKITRNVYYPNYKMIKICKDHLRKKLKRINSKESKVFCNMNFGPINMSKSWNESENNIKILKNELSR